MKKRIVSILLSLAMVVSMMPAMAAVSFADAKNSEPAVEAPFDLIGGITKLVTGIYGTFTSDEAMAQYAKWAEDIAADKAIMTEKYEAAVELYSMIQDPENMSEAMQKTLIDGLTAIFEAKTSDEIKAALATAKKAVNAQIEAEKVAPKVVNKSFTYTSKKKTYTGTVQILDKDGKVLASKKYSVKTPGTWTFKFAGNYYYKPAKATFKVVVKNASIKKLKKAKKAFTVKVGKLSKNNVTGYQVRYSRKSSMKSAKIKTIGKKYNKVSKKVTKLKAKKTYYVQVRAYKTVSGKKYYSSWSAAKKVKTK